MPYTQKTGRYYKVVNGKRQYDSRFDRPPQGAVAPRKRAAPRAARSVAPKTQVSRSANRVIPQKSESGAGRALLEGGGSLLGGTLFGPVGAAVGGLAGGALSSIMGLGAYEIKQNVFMDGRLPLIVNDAPSGGTIIRHTEYLGDVITSSVANTFNLQVFPLNPAVETTFPWLAQIAANYEEYEFEGLLFQFRSTSADALNSVNTALGSVIMATNYDAADPLFASKTEMLNYEFSCSTKPSDSLMHMIECAPSQTVLGHRYTRPGLAPAGTDIRFFDLGNFQIATTGFQGTNVNIGELHCTYQVRLLKPKLFVALGADINYARHTSDTGVTALVPLGTNGSDVIVSDNFGITITATVVSFPVTQVVETYWVYYLINGTVAAAIVSPVITTANCSAVPASTAQTPVNGTSSTSFAVYFKIQTAGNSLIPTLTFGVAGTFPGGTVGRLIVITQAPNNLP